MKSLAGTITVALIYGILAHRGYSLDQVPSLGAVQPSGHIVNATSDLSGTHASACFQGNKERPQEPQSLERNRPTSGGEEMNACLEEQGFSDVFNSSHETECITRRDAATFISRMTAVLEHKSSDLGDKVETANNITAENFEFLSNSIRSTLGYPLNQPVSQSKQESVKFMTQVSKPYVNVSTLDLLVDCNKISWHFDFGKVGSGKYPVRGFALVDLSPTLQMTRLSIEFDSLSYGINTGIRAIYRNGTTIPT